MNVQIDETAHRTPRKPDKTSLPGSDLVVVVARRNLEIGGIADIFTQNVHPGLEIMDRS
jgi:hypothetical protein